MKESMFVELAEDEMNEIDGGSVVQMRAWVTSQGGRVSWNESTRTATFELNGRRLTEVLNPTGYYHNIGGHLYATKGHLNSYFYL